MEPSCHITITQCYFKFIAQVQAISAYHSVQIHISDICHRLSICCYSPPHCTSNLVCPLFSAPLHSSNRSAIFVHCATLLTWLLSFMCKYFNGKCDLYFLAGWLIVSGCELVGFCNVLSSKQLFQWLLGDTFGNSQYVTSNGMMDNQFKIICEESFVT
jgi:hypothetical protein